VQLDLCFSIIIFSLTVQYRPQILATYLFLFRALLPRSKTWPGRISSSSYWFPGLLIDLLGAAAILTKVNAGMNTRNMASFGFGRKNGWSCPNRYL